MSNTYRILVACDDPTTSVVLKHAMQQAGHEVFAPDAELALPDATQRYGPDLILLDVPLDGDVGGLSQVVRDCQGDLQVPIILIVDGANTEQVVAAFAAGACDYIARPFTRQEVQARVALHLRLRQAECDLQAKQSELATCTEQLASLARKDPLTDLLNRHAWEEQVAQQNEIHQRYGRPYSVVLVNLDHFRGYNDSCGHQAGDECLRRVAEAINGACRRVDCVGRYGGKVFAVLAPETDGEQAMRLADRIHRAIWNLGIPYATNGSARITASIGISVSSDCSWEQVLRKADAAVLVAKRAGRNMVYADQSTGPAASAEPSQKSESARSDRVAAEENVIEVLVVDDDPTNRAVCKGCLQKTGYRIREAGDGHAALAEVQAHRPDVIIMDVMMPNMDGLECTRALRADPDMRDIPIIIVSALSRTEDILAGLQAGADEYISKPIRSSELTLRVQSMVRLHRERLDLLHSYEQRGRQMRILSRMVEFCRAVGLCKTADEILQHTVSTVADVMECRRVSIMLPDETGQALTIASAVGLDRSLTRSVSVTLGEPIAGRVFESGQAIIVNSESEPGVRSSDYEAPYFASIPLISAPLDAAGRVVGVLNATEKSGGLPFEDRDLEYIELISKVAGTALHDLRMREARDQASDSIMVALASLAECRDNDTGKHLDRVTRYCVLLADSLRKSEPYASQIDDAFMYNLERSVPLHDIGKVAIPDDILLFPGKLSSEQMAIMRTHSTVGAQTIESLMARAPGVCFLEMARDIAGHHHERYDGGGYPDGLRGKDIPLAARITSVADVYDALTTRRVYKEACSHETAVSIILEGSGSSFDPDVVEAFIEQEKTFSELAESMADALPPKPEQVEQPVLSGTV